MRSVIIITVLALSQSALGQGSDSLRVASDKTAGGFVFPESCGYHAGTKALYVGNFGGAKLDPAAKDGQGYISKVGLDGKVLEQKFLPAAGGEALNKPKGIWIQGNRLWVTDIDVELVKVEPADFLNAKKEPAVTEVFSGASVNPNGLYPARDGRLYMVGFLAADKPKPIFALGVSGQIKQLSDPIGRLDGIYEMKDGSLLFTDWNTGSLSRWSEKGGVQKLADVFKGPADFCVVPGAGGAMTVVVPDLPQSQLRFIQLSR